MHTENVKMDFSNSLSFKDRKKSRKLCIEALYIYQFQTFTPTDILSLKWIVGTNLPVGEIKDYFEYLFLGSIHMLDKSTELITELANRKEEEYLFKIDRAILQLAIFSLFNEKDIPMVVTINEAIKLAKVYSGVEGYKFINSILDGVYKKYII